jgi:signal peptidase I
MLIVILGMSILLATRLLLQRRMAQRLAIVAGSSMEPCLIGPRLRIDCPECNFENRFALDAWQPNRPTHCMACNAAIEANDPSSVLPGQTIAYAPLPSTDEDLAPLPTILHRWDVVILRRGDSTSSEIKRVVGLPGESVAIRDGHVWIDGRRATKSYTEFLEQAVLVGHWSPGDAMSIGDWLGAIEAPLWNDLPINAHDSHALLPCNEFGVSLRVAEASPTWNCRMQLATAIGPIAVSIQRDAGSLAILFDEGTNTYLPPDATLSTRLTCPANWKPKWLHWIVMEGRCLVADETRFLGSIELPTDPKDPSPTSTSINRLATWSPNSQGLRCDRGLVYRGRVMRGYGDAPQGQFPDGDGVVVLGDNVSISDDSRGAGSASVRIPLSAIRGRWISPGSPMESLLAQAASVPSARMRATYGKDPQP